ncbi:MAG: aldo/keto reductase [Eubacterium sp.]
MGVSNFGLDRYLDIEHFSEIKPAVNQIGTHVFQQQKAAREYLQKYNCQIESWAPFAEGKSNIFTNPILTEIGAKYGKSAAQTALRFLLQSGVVIIPKSVHKDRMKDNFNLFDFSLSEEDMKAIEALDGGESLFFSHYDPKIVEWFMSMV